MAFQIHWKIPFKSLRAGTDYCVNIYKDGTLPTGYPLILEGGSQPFTTQEDDNEDMFTPIRTQTGYLRIVDTDKALNSASTPQIVTWNWKELLPNTDTDRPVTLTANGTVVWHGFMQAQNFGGVLYGNPQEREFPVHCALTILEGTDINYQQTAIQNFAYLLQRIVNTVDVQSGGMETSGVITTNGTVHIENIIIQGNTDARNWLMKKIDWQNFVDEDGVGNLIARFNLYQCLEDLCRFWGWTARTYRKNLYLTRADDSSNTNWITLTRANLDTLAGGSTAGTTGGAFTLLEPTGDIFASVDQSDIRQRGANRSTVKADGNKADEEFLEFAPDKFCKTMTDGGWQGAISDDDMYVNYTVDKLQMSLPLMVASAVSGNASLNVAKIQESLEDEGNEYPVIRIKKTYSGSVFASMETVYHHSFKGILVLYGEIYRKAHKLESMNEHSLTTVGNKTMIMRLGIGTDRNHASWWNGRTWDNSITTFKAAIGGSDGIIWSKWESQTELGGTSVFYTRNIGVSGKVGRIFVDFLGSSDLDDIDGQKSFEVSEFSLNIQQKPVGRSFGNKEDWLSIREYKSSNQNNVRIEWNADCIYATDLNMANGFGVILNADDSHFEGYDYGSGTMAPEQHMANRVTTYWAAAKRKLEVELRADQITEPSPQNRMKIDYTTGYPIAFGREWCDDVTKLTILEL